MRHTNLRIMESEFLFNIQNLIHAQMLIQYNVFKSKDKYFIIYKQNEIIQWNRKQ